MSEKGDSAGIHHKPKEASRKAGFLVFNDTTGAITLLQQKPRPPIDHIPNICHEISPESSIRPPDPPAEGKITPIPTGFP